MQISKRLETVAGMVTPGCKVADIGTDHAYIPIYLVSGGIVPSALAMDVNKGPLEKAVTHIGQYGLTDRIETRLSDGLAAMKPGEAKSIIIAGMGGPLTIRILKEGDECVEAARELILQPQSEIRLVRAYLEAKGYRIVQEHMVYEDGKYYPMMKAQKCVGKEKSEAETAGGSVKCEKMTDLQLRYGPMLLEAKSEVLRDYLLREQELNRRILSALKGQTGEAADLRRREVEYEQQLICEALQKYETR